MRDLHIFVIQALLETLDQQCVDNSRGAEIGIPERTSGSLLKSIRENLNTHMQQAQYLNAACLQKVLYSLSSYNAQKEDALSNEDYNLYLQKMADKLVEYNPAYCVDRSNVQGVKTDLFAALDAFFNRFSDTQIIQLPTELKSHLMVGFRAAATAEFTLQTVVDKMYLHPYSLVTQPELFTVEVGGKLTPFPGRDTFKVKPTSAGGAAIKASYAPDEQSDVRLYDKSQSPRKGGAARSGIKRELPEAGKIHTTKSVIVGLHTFLTKHLVSSNPVHWLCQIQPDVLLHQILYLLLSKWNPCLRYYFFLRQVLLEEQIAIEQIAPDQEQSIFSVYFDPHKPAFTIKMQVNVMSGQSHGQRFEAKTIDKSPIRIQLSCEVIMRPLGNLAAYDFKFLDSILEVNRQALQLFTALPRLFKGGELYDCIARFDRLALHYRASGLYDFSCGPVTNSLRIDDSWQYLNNLNITVKDALQLLAEIPNMVCADLFSESALTELTNGAVSVNGDIIAVLDGADPQTLKQEFLMQLEKAGCSAKAAADVAPVLFMLLSNNMFHPIDSLFKMFEGYLKHVYKNEKFIFPSVEPFAQSGVKHHITFDHRGDALILETSLCVREVQYSNTTLAYDSLGFGDVAIIVFSVRCIIPLNKAPIRFDALNCQYSPIVFTMHEDILNGFSHKEFIRRKQLADELGFMLKKFVRGQLSRLYMDEYYLDDKAPTAVATFFDNLLRLHRFPKKLLDDYKRYSLSPQKVQQCFSLTGEAYRIKLLEAAAKDYNRDLAFNHVTVVIPEDISVKRKYVLQLLKERFETVLGVGITNEFVSAHLALLDIFTAQYFAGPAELVSTELQEQINIALGGDSMVFQVTEFEAARVNVSINAENNKYYTVENRQLYAKMMIEGCVEPVNFEALYLSITCQIKVFYAVDKPLEYSPIRITYNPRFYETISSEIEGCHSPQFLENCRRVSDVIRASLVTLQSVYMINLLERAKGTPPSNRGFPSQAAFWEAMEKLST
jgi:hypothetical protein